jgi:hypothetical protein
MLTVIHESRLGPWLAARALAYGEDVHYSRTPTVLPALAAQQSGQSFPQNWLTCVAAEEAIEHDARLCVIINDYHSLSTDQTKCIC